MLTRRQFLSRGATVAGAAAAAHYLPPGMLEALAAAPSRGPLSAIEHVVIFIQENRSFDHYFGTYRAVRGFDDRSVTLPDGSSVFAQKRADGSVLLPFHIDTSISTAGPRPGECTDDIDHQWATQHAMWDGGAMDAWLPVHEKTVPKDADLTMGYYTRHDIPLYYALADLFTICDRYHCSVIGGTDINRIYSVTGTMDPDGFDGGVQFLDTRETDRQKWFGKLGSAGRWKTYPEVLEEHEISWRVYATTDAQQENNVLAYFKGYTDPSSPLFRKAMTSGGAGPIPPDFLADCAAGTLPQVSWVLASLTDSEHPPAPIEWGQDATYRLLQAITSNPRLWAKTALFITYDENGGFFDHVPPPVPPAGTTGESLTGLRPGTAAWTESGDGRYRGPIGLGFRVPMLVVSPFSRGGLVCSDVFDHTSLLRFVERRFRAPIPAYDASTRTPGLSPWRRAAVGDLTSAFDFASPPDYSVPALPATNRADPRVLAECVVTGEPGNLVTSQAGTPYPTPAVQQMPSQEPGTARRPSGLRGGGRDRG